MNPKILFLKKPNQTQTNLGLSNLCESGLYAKFPRLCQSWILSYPVGGWWVGGCLHLQNKATAWPNLHVRTCKIQAKLDSKLGPSVAIIPFLKITKPNDNQTKPNCSKHQGLSNFCDSGLYAKFQTPRLCQSGILS